MIRKFPKWATNYIVKWKKILFIQEWEIKTTISPHPNNEPDGVLAAVSIFPNVLKAVIEFKDTIPRNIKNPEITEWKITIIHELVHIRLSEITDFVTADILTEFSPGMNSLIGKMFERQVEPTVEILSYILYQLSEKETKQ